MKSVTSNFGQTPELGNPLGSQSWASSLGENRLQVKLDNLTDSAIPLVLWWLPSFLTLVSGYLLRDLGYSLGYCIPFSEILRTTDYLKSVSRRWGRAVSPSSESFLQSHLSHDRSRVEKISASPAKDANRMGGFSSCEVQLPPTGGAERPRSPVENSD